MVEIVVAAIVIAAMALSFSFLRTKRKFSRLQTELDQVWQEVYQALEARISALDELISSLRTAGYASEGVNKLHHAVEELRRCERDPRKLAEVDERVEAVLRGIYRALPRERAEPVKVAQNQLAKADEELDIWKNRYNELVFAWYELSRSFFYRFLGRGKVQPEPFAGPGEEVELLRRRLLSL